ncbi:MAG: hypothetical protein LBF22_04340 [Deltaproteobacteria bacterium]|jgi:hypothetical protein|nr:hypothetical protein [Deltaproteobacteria bacterium]
MLKKKAYLWIVVQWPLTLWIMALLELIEDFYAKCAASLISADFVEESGLSWYNFKRNPLLEPFAFF